MFSWFASVIDSWCFSTAAGTEAASLLCEEFAETFLVGQQTPLFNGGPLNAAREGVLDVRRDVPHADTRVRRALSDLTQTPRAHGLAGTRAAGGTAARPRSVPPAVARLFFEVR